MKRRRITRRNDRILTAVTVLMSVMDAVGVAEKSCPRSNNVYSVRQKLVLLVLRQFLSLSYRDLCDTVPSLGRVCRSIGLRTVPHHTTLEKFAGTVDPGLVQRLIAGFSKACNDGELTVAVDGTGFSEVCISQYYTKKKKDFGLDPLPDNRRGFSKATYAGDVDGKIILACDICDQHNHDVTRMPDIVAHLKDADVDIGFILADKGYDAEWVHRMIRDELNATALIPARINTPKKGVTVYRTYGIHRSRMKRVLVKCTSECLRFRMRAIIECINSMVKRKMGGCVYSRLDVTKRTELMCRAIAHNMRRVLDLERQDRFV